MSNKSVLRPDRIKSQRVGHIYNCVQADDDLENGFVGILGDLVPGERELYNFVKPTTAGFATTPLVLVFNPELRYEQYVTTDNSLTKYYIEAGTPFNAYELQRTDIFSVSDVGIDTIDGTGGTVGNYVVPQNNSYKLKEVDSIEGITSAFVGKIIAKESIGTTTYVGSAGNASNIINFIVIEVVKNS